MSRRTPISHKEMARLGWTRTDPKPWRTKLSATWEHGRGWTLTHCGHPTANWPWILLNPAREMVLTGVQWDNPPNYGTCWPDLRTAATWLDGHLHLAAAAR